MVSRGALSSFKLFESLLSVFCKPEKKAFGVSLVFYKGAQIADGDLTLNQLNQKTTKQANTKAEDLKIKASMKVGDAEKLFDKQFGVTVQIKDADAKKLVPNEITIGQAARGEY